MIGEVMLMENNITRKNNRVGFRIEGFVRLLTEGIAVKNSNISPRSKFRAIVFKRRDEAKTTKSLEVREGRRRAM